MNAKLIKPREMDAVLRYPAGRSARLARAGKIPHVELPDGEIRFDPDIVTAWLRSRATGEQGVDRAG